MDASAPAQTGAAIICFPQRRNVGKVRHVAQHMLRRAEGRARETYWNQVCNRMAGTMAKAGIGDDEITHQLNAFSDAVGWEMHKIANADRQRPGGAA
ncbi:DUF6074 family protein [Devosia indica]